MLIPYFAVVLLLLGERPAFAYVDPGTGSLLYQTALTMVLGLSLVFRRVRVSIVHFVKRLVGRRDDADRAAPRTESDPGA